MNYRVFCAADRIKGFGNNMLSRLCENLDGHVIRNKISLYQGAAELIFGLRGGGKSHFDLLEADLTEKLKELKLFLKAHRNYQGLISVTKIDAAPNRSFFDFFFLHPVHRHPFGGEELRFVLLISLHIYFPFGDALLLNKNISHYIKYIL